MFLFNHELARRTWQEHANAVYNDKNYPKTYVHYYFEGWLIYKWKHWSVTSQVNQVRMASIHLESLKLKNKKAQRRGEQYLNWN